jgi:hypothetical protein
MQRRLFKFIFVSLLVLPLCLHAESLDTATLTNIAFRYNLPMPPKGARLVLAYTESNRMLGNRTTSRDPGIYSPAFLLEQKTNGDIVVLRGSERQKLVTDPKEALWRPFSIPNIKPKLGGFEANFGRLSAFVCAVQLASRGEESTAQKIWQHFSAADYWNDGQPFENIPEQIKNPSLLLARCLFDHLRNQVLISSTNWVGIQAQMSALFDDFPALKDEERIKVLDGLTAAISAKPPPKDSVEALLLDWSRRPNMRDYYNLFDDKSEQDAPAREIILRGAASVPDLVALLGDRRITTHEIPAIMNSRAEIQEVGGLAGILLENITGIRASRFKLSNAVPFQAWLESRDGKGEEELLAEALFTRKDGKITWVNESPAHILAQKFPERLISLCDEFSKNATPDTQPFTLAEVLATANLPKEIRVKTLVEFAQRGSLEHKRSVLQNLAKIDDKKCAELLLPLLEKMPNDSTGPYWTCPEAAFTHVVMEVEDDDIWRRYVQVAKRSSVGMRMEMMDPLCYTYIGMKNRERRLAFLAAFLDDKTVRNIASNPTKFDGPCAAFTIPKITVRDFAALRIASILDFPESPDEFWTSAQWNTLRKKVREKLTAEKIPNFGEQNL